MSALGFSVISILAEAAAAHLGPESTEKPAANLREARLAIDAANALLGALMVALSSDERLALEALLTQLQLEYVKRAP